MDVKTMILINFIEIAIHIPLLLFQIFVVIFLFSKLTKPKSAFSSAYFAMLNSVYFLDIFFNIVWIYGHWVLYSRFSPWMPGVYFIQFHAQGLLGIWEMFLALNRCTALAFPSLHRKIWTRNLVTLYIIFIQISPYLFHWYVFPNFDCKFTVSYEARCFAFSGEANEKIAVVNIFFGMIALALIILGVCLSPKLESSQANSKSRMERRLIYQSFFSSSMLVLLYITSFFNAYVPYFINVSYALYLLQFYPPMFILFCISPVIREEFAKFYGFTYFMKNNNNGNASTNWRTSTVKPLTTIT